MDTAATSAPIPCHQHDILSTHAAHPPALHAACCACRRADSARSMSRRGSASGRLASLSKSLSQALAFPGSERRDRYAAAAAPAAAADGALPPHTVAVALPVM